RPALHRLLPLPPEKQPPSPLQVPHEPQPVDEVVEAIIQQNRGDLTAAAQVSENAKRMRIQEVGSPRTNFPETRFWTGGHAAVHRHRESRDPNRSGALSLNGRAGKMNPSLILLAALHGNSPWANTSSTASSGWRNRKTARSSCGTSGVSPSRSSIRC